MNRLWPVLGAVLLLGGAGILNQPSVEAGGVAQPGLKKSAAPVLRFEQWLNPATGERVSLRFDGKKTTVQRGTAVSEHQNPAFDAVAEKVKLQAQTQSEWNPMFVQMWRMMLVEREGSRQAAQREFLRLGFPQKLWDELDAFDKHMKGGASEKPNQIPETYHSSLTITANDADSLLFNPPADLRRRFAEIWAGEIQISPPQPVASLDEQSGKLSQQGFIRLSPRRPDGSLWLPPALEPYRKPLQASEKPVLRLSAAPGHTPKLWDSKVGGVPYRPQGAAWPMSREAVSSGKKPRPLVFLAQINLAQANPGGRNLPDYPGHGILQFFILNSTFYGADAMYNAEGGMPDLSGPEDNYRVLYFPDVVQDATKLQTQVPKPQPDPAEVATLKKSGYTSLLDDENLIWEKLPFQREWIRSSGLALRFTPDREMVSRADNNAERILHVKRYSAAGISDPVSDLYDLSPGGHKLGGYPDFTQSDPRRSDQHWQLLFQLDSDTRLGLMWGDVGTANFFIRPADLKRRDFSHVAYHWDGG